MLRIVTGMSRFENYERAVFSENPPGGGSFARGRCWLGRYSPLRGCSDLAALATVKIPRRSIPRSFQKGSRLFFNHRWTRILKRHKNRKGDISRKLTFAATEQQYEAGLILGRVGV
jgi:hypothetical protein